MARDPVGHQPGADQCVLDCVVNHDLTHVDDRRPRDVGEGALVETLHALGPGDGDVGVHHTSVAGLLAGRADLGLHSDLDHVGGLGAEDGQAAGADASSHADEQEADTGVDCDGKKEREKVLDGICLGKLGKSVPMRWSKEPRNSYR